MSNSFNDQLSRMKALMTYGSVNENAKPISNYTLEYRATAADGKCYGIIRENSKYFVKVATPGKETIAEAYQYIGGITNKTNYEYNSYANALKQFELKLGSINEAYDENRKVNVEALDPFKKEGLVVEGTEKMKNELARQRQIMRNACVIMNEATEIGSTPFKSQPESEHDNSGDKDYPFTKEGKPEEDRGAIKFDGGDPEKHSSTFGPDSNDVEDYDLDKGKTPKVKDSVASENPKGGKVARVDESMGECGTGLFGEENDEDSFDFGQEEEPVNTEELDAVEPGEVDDEEDTDLETDDDMGLDDEDAEDFGDEGFEDDEEDDFDDDEDFGDEDEEDFDYEDDEEELGDEDEFGDDEDFDDGEETELELDENIVRRFRSLVRESIDEIMSEVGEEGDMPETGEEEDMPEVGEEEAFGPSMYGDNSFNAFGEDANDAKIEDALRNQEDEDWKLSSISEAKAAKMNSIVESVVNDILNEDELHVFGDHPGYRKKPMTLPQTGEDKNQWGRDWNDDSVHNEEPFGKGKGDSTPFDQLVAQITDSVMKQINEGKKKVK